MRNVILKSIIVISAYLFLTFQIYASGGTRFIIFGDSQFGNPPEFERMIYEASLLKPDFAIQIGDLIHGYTHDKKQLRSEWKRFKGQISLLNAPFYPVPGNHDVVTDESEEVNSDVWGKEKLLYSFDKGSAHFIVLNSWWGDEDDRIMEWQRKWLFDDLQNFASNYSAEELSSKSIFVFVHSPLWKYSNNHDGRKDWDLVHNILKDYPVKLVIGGHTHEHVWQEIDEINYLVINSAGVQNKNIRGGKFSSFLHVFVDDNGKVEYAVIKAGSILPIDSIDPTDRIEATKYEIKEKNVLIYDWVEGSKMDQSIEVEIENDLTEDRIYRLDWHIPYKANLKIIPESKWIVVPSKSSIIEIFNFKSESTPSIRNMPYLDVSTFTNYRTGSLSRKIEKKYRDGNINIEGYQPQINLDTVFEYNAKFNLFVPPSLIVKKVNGNIEIDGKFDEHAWSLSETIVFFGEVLKNNIKTEIKILYNSDFLYVAAMMDEPLPLGLQTSANGEIPLTWNDDDLELFFDIKKSQKDYIRLFQNAAGIRFNSLQRWVENKYFKSKYKSAIVIGDNFWALEMEIPWSDIDLKKGPSSGDEWAFNVGRHRQQSLVKQSRWAGGLYNPKSYGILKFE